MPEPEAASGRCSQCSALRNRFHSSPSAACLIRWHRGSAGRLKAPAAGLAVPACLHVPDHHTVIMHGCLRPCRPSRPIPPASDRCPTRSWPPLRAARWHTAALAGPRPGRGPDPEGRPVRRRYAELYYSGTAVAAVRACVRLSAESAALGERPPSAGPRRRCRPARHPRIRLRNSLSGRVLEYM